MRVARHATADTGLLGSVITHTVTCRVSFEDTTSTRAHSLRNNQTRVTGDRCSNAAHTHTKLPAMGMGMGMGIAWRAYATRQL